MKKTLYLPILLSVMLLWSLIPVYPWTEYKNISYVDFDGDLTDEIVIEAKHGAGSGHYIEDVRIYKDIYPELELIFTIRTLDSYFGLKQPYDSISDVEFIEPNPENGVRNIIVKSKKIYYKDDGKAIEKEEEIGTKIYVWNGKVFEVANINFDGEWIYNEEEYMFSVCLEQQGNRIKGEYSADIGRDGDKIDGIPLESENISGVVKGNVAEVTFKSDWGGTGKARITHKDDKIEWEIIKGTEKGQFYCPNSAILTKLD